MSKIAAFGMPHFDLCTFSFQLTNNNNNDNSAIKIKMPKRSIMFNLQTSNYYDYNGGGNDMSNGNKGSRSICAPSMCTLNACVI